MKASYPRIAGKIRSKLNQLLPTERIGNVHGGVIQYSADEPFLPYWSCLIQRQTSSTVSGIRVAKT